MVRPGRVIGSTMAVLALAVLPACGGGAGSAEGDGEITMWARGNAIGEGLFTPLVESWNASHDTQVNLTLIPSDQLASRLGAAAGAGDLPDILVSDVAALPNLVEQGQVVDISERIDALEFADELVPAHVAQGELDGARHAVPADVDVSAMFYNTTLLEEAGVDEAPTTFGEVADAAIQVSESTGASGFYAPGSCGGCLAFTTAPVLWASGSQPVTDDGSQITWDTPEMRETLGTYQRMWAAGALPEASGTDTGADWTNVFPAGDIAIQFTTSSVAGGLLAEDPGFEWDVAGIPGLAGEQSSFVGGDTFSISKDSQDPDRAWEFISWALAEEQQTGLYAAKGFPVVRADLLTEDTFDDPRLLKLNQLIEVGRLPRTPASASIFNDGTGPWLATFRRAVYEGDVAGAVTTGQQQAQDLLDQLG